MSFTDVTHDQDHMDAHYGHCLWRDVSCDITSFYMAIKILCVSFSHHKRMCFLQNIVTIFSGHVYSHCWGHYQFSLSDFKIPIEIHRRAKIFLLTPGWTWWRGATCSRIWCLTRGTLGFFWFFLLLIYWVYSVGAAYIAMATHVNIDTMFYMAECKWN
jgi:hypothetical protein